MEVVVVDDAPAATPAWRNYGDGVELWNDLQVRVVEFHQVRGCAAAKNAGLRAARGEWVCYLDDDNEMRADRVARQLALGRKRGVPLVLCGMEIQVCTRRRMRQVDRQFYGGDRLLVDTLPDTNVLFHRREAGLSWEEDLGTTDDACFFHALRRRWCLGRVLNVPLPLVIYRSHDSGERLNSNALNVYRRQRRLLTRWATDFSREARRLTLLRMMVTTEKFQAGRWGRFGALACGLWREGGKKELRFVINAAGVKCPWTRKWMVR